MYVAYFSVSGGEEGLGLRKQLLDEIPNSKVGIVLNNLHIATFNLENLDDKPGEKLTLAERIAVMRSQLLRLKADILWLQEVNGQETAGEPRRLLALNRLIKGTPYAAT